MPHDHGQIVVPIRAGLLAVLLLMLDIGVAYAQQDSAKVCAHGRISSVIIHNHSIFDIDEAADRGHVPWIYRVANAIHMKTKESFIRREILFKKGDCYEPLLLEESGRLLRQYPFIASAEVSAVDLPDGDKKVVVDTQDDWTTQVNLDVSLDPGLQLEVLDVSEQDLLGRGILTSAFIRQRNEARDVGGHLGVPHLFGTRIYGSLIAGRTRVGTLVDQSFMHPFVGQVGKVSFGESYLHDDELFPYSTGGSESWSHVLLPFLDERFVIQSAGRVGEPGNLTTLGFRVSYTRLEFAGFPGNVEITSGSGFSHIQPAPPGAATPLTGQTHARSTTSVDLVLGQSNVHFRKVRGLDALDGEMDVELGTDVQARIGRSLDATPGADAMEGAVRLYEGRAMGPSFLFGNLQLQGRRLLSGGGGGWRDVIGELDVYSYLRSRRMPHQTLFARVSGAGGWSMDIPFQLTLGGRSSVRGLPLEDDPGARRLIVTLEDRFFVPWPAPDIFDAGFTLFGDAGRTWAGDVPFGVGSNGWRGTLGFGLRFGFPAGTKNVLRADLAFPVGVPGRSAPIFRVSLRELLGLSAGFAERQIERSRH